NMCSPCWRCSRSRRLSTNSAMSCATAPTGRLFRCAASSRSAADIQPKDIVMDQPVQASKPVVDNPPELHAEAPADAHAGEQGDSALYTETHAPLHADAPQPSGAPAHA